MPPHVKVIVLHYRPAVIISIFPLTKFPKFVKALVENDFDTAAKEFERKSGNVKLGRRNTASEKEIAAIKAEETTTT